MLFIRVGISSLAYNIIFAYDKNHKILYCIHVLKLRKYVIREIENGDCNKEYVHIHLFFVK